MEAYILVSILAFRVVRFLAITILGCFLGLLLWLILGFFLVLLFVVGLAMRSAVIVVAVRDVFPVGQNPPARRNRHCDRASRPFEVRL